jgi:hypothetical protein
MIISLKMKAVKKTKRKRRKDRFLSKGIGSLEVIIGSHG